MQSCTAWASSDLSVVDGHVRAWRRRTARRAWEVWHRRTHLDHLDAALRRLERLGERGAGSGAAVTLRREEWGAVVQDVGLLVRALREGVMHGGADGVQGMVATEDAVTRPLGCRFEIGSWQLRHCTPSFAGVLGRRPEELRGHDVRELFLPADRAAIEAVAQALVDGKQAPAARVRLGGEGRLLPFVVAGALVQGEGRREVQLSLRDVSREQRLDKQLRHAQRLATVGRLARGVAHDLNNLITVIRATVALASDAAAGAGIGGELEEVDRAAARAAELTQQLLVFSRRCPAPPQVVDLGESLERIGRLLRRALGEDVTFVEERSAGLWAVRADPAQLDQLVTQLVLCTPAAVGAGGRVTVRADNCTLGAEAQRLEAAPGDFVRLRITQDAEADGIRAASSMALDGSSAPPCSSMDDGALLSCQSIARQLGGTFELGGEGSAAVCFTVYLPRAVVAPRTPSDTPPSPRRGRGERILLVDDDGQVRAALRRVLENAGYRVSEAADARAALATAEGAAPYALLITDVIMPDLPGPRLAQELRQAGAVHRVLYVTGHAGELVARHGIELTELDLLAKPFVPERLLARVQQLLERDSNS